MGGNTGDFVFTNVTRLFALILLALVVVMGYEMLVQSLPSIQKFGWKFITDSTWDPVHEEFGALPFIFGTLASSLLALLISVVLSIGTAIFLSEFAPRWLEKIISMMVELLAAIPSIVYGLFGIFVLAPWLRDSVEPWLGDHLGFIPLFQGAPYGIGMLSAVLILTIMILPIITSISRDIMKAIPDAQREAAFALGATKWEVVRVVLSGAKSGILGAALLGLGRAVGETMAVTMVIGNSPQVSFSLFDVVLPAAFKGIFTGVLLSIARAAGETAPLLFTALGNRFWSTHLDQPIASLTVFIYDYSKAPFEDWNRQAWAAALVLIMLIMIINVTFRLISRRKI